jgi:hypothetical protein
MADNRMRLRHRATGKEVMIAKFHVSTGWYVRDDDLIAKLTALFDDPEHDLAERGTERGDDYVIAFDSDNEAAETDASSAADAGRNAAPGPASGGSPRD